MNCTLLIWTSISAVSLLEVICTISTRSAGNVVSGRNTLQIHCPNSPTVPVTFPEPHSSTGYKEKERDKTTESICLILGKRIGSKENAYPPTICWASQREEQKNVMHHVLGFLCWVITACPNHWLLKMRYPVVTLNIFSHSHGYCYLILKWLLKTTYVHSHVCFRYYELRRQFANYDLVVCKGSCWITWRWCEKIYCM